jgi:hypothetical protein
MLPTEQSSTDVRGGGGEGDTEKQNRTKVTDRQTDNVQPT